MSVRLLAISCSVLGGRSDSRIAARTSCGFYFAKVINVLAAVSMILGGINKRSRAMVLTLPVTDRVIYLLVCFFSGSFCCRAITFAFFEKKNLFEL